jgi:hypothetical protein
MNQIATIAQTADPAASDHTANDQAVQDSIMNFAVALAQGTRSELSDNLSKLEHKWAQIKQESGEQ